MDINSSNFSTEKNGKKEASCDERIPADSESFSFPSVCGIHPVTASQTDVSHMNLGTEPAKDDSAVLDRTKATLT